MDKLPLITSAFLNLTNACNLACKYCFVEQHPDFMTYQTAQDAADFLANNAIEINRVPSINFFGGEPLLMWDEIIVPLTNYVREKYGNQFNLSMTTNGILLDKEKLEFMRKNSIGMLLSIDGNKSTQDINRPCKNGQSSFDILNPKLDLILEYFPNVMFRSTVTEDTQNEMFDNMMFAERHGFTSIFTMPNCFESWVRSDGLEREMRKYSNHYIDCMRNGKDPIYFSQLEKYFSKILMYNQAINKGEHRTFSKCKACGKCGLGSGSGAGININGDIIACQEFFSHERNQFYIGNIYDGVRDDLREALISNFDNSPVYGESCNTCQLNHICDGGCVANNYMLYGDMHHVSPIYCKWDKILFNEAVYIMTTLGNEQNEKFKDRWNSYVG